MPKMESKTSIILATVAVVLLGIVGFSLLFIGYLYRFAGYEPTLEEIFSKSNILKTIAILIIVFGIAIARVNKKSDDK